MNKFIVYRFLWRNALGFHACRQVVANVFVFFTDFTVRGFRKNLESDQNEYQIIFAENGGHTSYNKISGTSHSFSDPLLLSSLLFRFLFGFIFPFFDQNIHIKQHFRWLNVWFVQIINIFEFDFVRYHSIEFQSSWHSIFWWAVSLLHLWFSF